jgi:hypothetical protein
MSNKLTRKGITFGTIVAFALSALVGVAPASAAATSLPTVPAAGSTYESIREAGAWLKTTVTGGSITNDLSYRIQSATPGLSTDQLWDQIVAGTVVLTFQYDATGAPAHNASTGALGALSFDCELKQVRVNDGTTIVVSFVEAASPFCNQVDAGETDWDDSNTTMELAVGSAVYVGIKAADSATNQDLIIDVRAHDDTDNNEQINGSEAASAVQRVTLYDNANVRATTTITQLAVGSEVKSSVTFNKPKLNTYFVTSYAQGSSLASAFYNSTSTTVAGAFDWAKYVPQVTQAWVTAENAKTDKSNVFNFPLVATTSGATVTAGNYAARASLNSGGGAAPTSGNWVTWMGLRSVNSALLPGNNALATEIYGFVTDTANVVQLDANEVAVRVGTNTATVTAQIAKTNDEDLAASDVRVKAVFTKVDFEDADTTISFAGSSSVIDEDTDSVTLYGRTDAKGQVSFTFTSSDAQVFDRMKVDFSVLLTSGAWSTTAPASTASTVHIQWQKGYLADFDVDPSGPVSGANVSLTYTALDQFGVGISNPGTKASDAYQVTLIGTDDENGALDEDSLRETKALVNGRATFTFANYATVDSFVWVTGILHQVKDGEIDARGDAYDFEGTEGTSGLDYIATNGYDDADLWANGDSIKNTQVFKNAATSEIAGLEKQYVNVVTYQTFASGNYTDDKAFKKIVDTTGLYSNSKSYISGEFATITGTVETTSGVGAVAQQVTLSGSGLLFVKDRVDGYDEVHAIGSITVWTDVDGNFEVDVYSHRENLAGLNVSITSGGKSFSTKVVTGMNSDIDNEEFYNAATKTRIDAAVVTWNWKKLTGNAPAANTRYMVTVTAKDVWGNLLRNADLEVTGRGYADIGVVTDQDDYRTITTSSAGTASFTVQKGSFFQWQEDAGEDAVWAVGGSSGYMLVELDSFDYKDGSEDLSLEFTTSSFNSGLFKKSWSGNFGPQATATAGAKKGVVRVNAYNVKGKTVRVFVAGKLVKTVTSDKAKFLTKVKGVKSGTKRVTVRVGAKRMITTFVAIK